MYDLVYDEEKSMTFKINEGWFIDLYTSPKFKSGTTLSHLDVCFDNSLDYLMTHCSNSNKTITYRGNNSKIYGPNTIEILKTIGWNTKDCFNNEILNIYFISEWFEEDLKRENLEILKFERISRNLKRKRLNNCLIM